MVFFSLVNFTDLYLKGIKREMAARQYILLKLSPASFFLMGFE